MKGEGQLQLLGPGGGSLVLQMDNVGTSFLSGSRGVFHSPSEVIPVLLNGCQTSFEASHTCPHDDVEPALCQKQFLRTMGFVELEEIV